MPALCLGLNDKRKHIFGGGVIRLALSLRCDSTVQMWKN